MNFFSADLNRFATARPVPANVPDPAKAASTAFDIPGAESGEWKASLSSKLQTTLDDRRERTPKFEKLFNDYVSSEPVRGRKCLKHLVGLCMQLPEPDVLKEILRNEVVESLHLEGQVSAEGWKTLIAALPAGFAVKVLALSIMRIHASELGLLLKALQGMPELEKLCLYMVGVQGGVPPDGLEGPAFEALEAVVATTSSVPDTDLCVLLLEILEACQLRSLSIQDYGTLTAAQHAELGEALGRQRLLRSVSLSVEQPCSTPKRLECYMPFLLGQAPLATLNLNGWELGTSTFNLLLTALQDKPTLTSLSLCNLKFPEGTGFEPVQISPLSRIRSLLGLDLGWNCLEEDTIVQLLIALKQEQTGLMFLSLNGSSIGSPTIAATAALLSASRTLQELSLQLASGSVSAGWDDGALEALAKAFEANTSLQRFRASWARIPEAYQSRMADSIQRNRRSFAANGMWAALDSARPGFPKDVAMHIYERGLRQADAVSMSSVNKAAWNARSGGDGSSK